MPRTWPCDEDRPNPASAVDIAYRMPVGAVRRKACEPSALLLETACSYCAYQRAFIPQSRHSLRSGRLGYMRRSMRGCCRAHPETRHYTGIRKAVSRIGIYGSCPGEYALLENLFRPSWYYSLRCATVSPFNRVRVHFLQTPVPFLRILLLNLTGLMPTSCRHQTHSCR
jgi:hypothetical protein